MIRNVQIENSSMGKKVILRMIVARRCKSKL